MHTLRSLVKVYPVEAALVGWVVLMLTLGTAFTSCYTGNPPTVCNPADFGCSQPFGARVDGGPG